MKTDDVRDNDFQGKGAAGYEPAKGGKGAKRGGVIDGLISIHDESIVSEKMLAGVLGVSDRTVRRMVNRGELPAPFLLAHRRSWRTADVKKHIDGLADKAQRDRAIEDAEKARISQKSMFL